MLEHKYSYAQVYLLSSQIYNVYFDVSNAYMCAIQ